MDQLIVALDVDTAAQAERLAGELRGIAGAFKIGSQLFTSEGPSIVRRLVERGDRIFLDLKFHDIPNTVAGAVRCAARLGVWMLTVHTAGGRAMMRAAIEAAGKGSNGQTRPLVIGVTVLTSLDSRSIVDVGVDRAFNEYLGTLADLAHGTGIDGVVSSPLELPYLRGKFSRGFTLVTPGIRSAVDPVRAGEDQARTMGAGEALAAGADYIVVGRPIIAAPDPRAAAEQLVNGAGR